MFRSIKSLIKPDEYLLIISGLFILLSVAIVSSGGGFGLWVVAKIFYGIGVIVHVFTH